MRNLLLALAFLLPAPARALSSNAGTSGAQFLKLGAGARAGAMADTQLALANDVYAAYYNPAGLAFSDGPQIAGMHNDYFQGVNYDFLGVSHPARGGVLAASVANLSANGIDRRTDDTDAAIDQFGVSESAYALSYGWKRTENLALGATVKYIHSKLDVVGAGAFALDAGLRYRWQVAKPIDLALVVRNVGSGLSYELGSDPLPLTLGAGAGVELFSNFKVGLDVMKARDTDPYASLGLEYVKSFNKELSGALRGGYTTHYSDTGGLAGAALGAGLTWRRASLDFAWVPFGDLGNTFRYSLLVKF